MKRKVNKIGPSTLMVSLPSKWAKKYGIKAGDEVEVEEEGEKIILAGSLNLPKKEVTIELPKLKDFLTRFLCSPYVKGYDIINVRFKDKEVYDRILKESKLLMGFEIVENKENSCRLMNISTKLEQNFEILISRLFTSAISFSRETFERLKKEDKELKSLLEYEFNTNRLSLFCRRALQTTTIPGTVHSPATLYSIVGHLEEIADNIRHIIQTVTGQKIKLRKETKELFEKAIKVQEINFKIFTRMMKGKTAMDELEMFKEHKRIRKDVFHDASLLEGNKIDSFIAAQLSGIIEISHHINEELFY